MTYSFTINASTKRTNDPPAPLERRVSGAYPQRNQKLKTLIEKQATGYGLMDWAFYTGSNANMVNT
ncbi:MAG: hypothetical protein QGH66_06080 [Dehalococcoidia bacterium]|jgi:hypothetical protein|nr:hypothetical protein [Dehalococcoidia bacterium]MDP7470020.1 hypothetical protein [Dehalococcoidia bacterium]